MEWTKTRTKVVPDSNYKKLELTSAEIHDIVSGKVRLSKRFTIPVMSQEKAAIVSEFSGIGTIEP